MSILRGWRAYLVLFHLRQRSLQRLEPARSRLHRIAFLHAGQPFMGPAGHCMATVSLSTPRNNGSPGHVQVKHWPNSEVTSKSSPWSTMELPKWAIGSDLSLSSPSLRFEIAFTYAVMDLCKRSVPARHVSTLLLPSPH